MWIAGNLLAQEVEAPSLCCMGLPQVLSTLLPGSACCAL